MTSDTVNCYLTRQRFGWIIHRDVLIWHNIHYFSPCVDSEVLFGVYLVKFKLKGCKIFYSSSCILQVCEDCLAPTILLAYSACKILPDL